MRGRKRIAFPWIAALGLALASIVLNAPAATASLAWKGEGNEIAFGGSARSFSFFQSAPELAQFDSDSEALVVQRLRLESTCFLGDDIDIELAYDISALIGAAGAELLSLAALPELRLTDLDPGLSGGSNYRLRQNLDRASLRLRLPGAELILGRQAITLGRALLLSPADWIAPFAPGALDSEYKPGVDALRLSKSFGFDREVELILVGHEEDLQDGAGLLRYYSAFSGWELSSLVGYSYREPTLTLVLAGEWGGAGWYTEALYRRGKERDDNLRATLGLSGALNPRWFGAVELHYSSLGASAPEDIPQVHATPEWLRGELYLASRLYGAVSLNWQATPLLTPALIWIQNLEDGSALIEPMLEWDFAENVALACGAVLGLGKAPEPSIPYGPPQLRSEFGSAPEILFAEARFYF
jgi:hypothetical protein